MRSGLFVVTVVAAVLLATIVTAPAAPRGPAGPSAPPPELAPGVTVRSGITYQVDDGDPEQLDAYLPAGKGPHGGVVLIHGGGWTTGSRTVLAPEAAQLAAQGYVAFTIDYRLEDDPTQIPWTDPVDDAQAAVLYVAEHADEFGLDRTRIAVLGASAGGWLAAMLATLGTLDDTTGQDQNATPGRVEVPIVAAVSWSGIFDLPPLQSVDGQPLAGCDGDPACGLLQTPTGFEDLTGCSIEACPQTFADASPLDHVSDSTAPMALFNSARELIPLSQPRTMSSALDEHDVTNELLVVPGSDHAQQYAATAWDRTLAFLEPYLGPPTATTPVTLVDSPPVPGTLPPPPGELNASGASTTDDPASDESSDDSLTAGLLVAGAAVLVCAGAALLVVGRRRRARRP
jgi:acetyl esterase/lipase